MIKLLGAFFSCTIILFLHSHSQAHCNLSSLLCHPSWWICKSNTCLQHWFFPSLLLASEVTPDCYSVLSHFPSVHSTRVNGFYKIGKLYILGLITPPFPRTWLIFSLATSCALVNYASIHLFS